jgi:hypothetical protein
MRSIIRLAAVTATALAAVAATAVPAMASGGPSTSTSFSLSAGALNVSAPATANLGTFSIDAGSASGSLGPVTVTDNRGLLVGTWTASVISTSWVNGGSTIPASAGNYSAGLATVTGGIAVPVPGLGTLSSTTALTAQSAVVLLGSNTATWSPTVTVTLPAGVASGTYTATITHSVA